MSYAELERRSNRLARRLRALGVKPETRVGVCLERTPETVVALLGILKSGGAFVPLDPAHPEDRLAYMLEDAAVAVVLTAERLLPRLPAGGARALCLDSGWAEVAAESAAPLDEAASPESLAYVIYTSGSTGRPKGVRVAHGSLLNVVLASAGSLDFRPGDVVPSLAAFGFDVWIWEVLCPLVVGGTVRVVPRGSITDPAALAAEVRDATLFHAVPTLARPLARAVAADGPWPGVRRVYVGGDAMAADGWAELRAAFPRAELWVIYGPTEAAIWITVHPVEDPSAVARSMIGRPLANTHAHVCDAPGRLVPVGVPGELLLGGVAVAQGYLGRPELTAEKFVPDPFGGVPGARLYRTGDRVRRLADGAMEFLGRTDNQVKLRGYRIEAGEVEAALLRHPAVDDALVMVREDEPRTEGRRLAAYLLPPRGERAPGAAELRAFLRAAVPEYMIPSAFVALEAWPLNSSGKVDRGALPAPERGSERVEYVAPRDATEEVLARAWSEVLRVPRVGVHDDFFQLGGDSVLSIQVAARAQRAGVALRPRDFFAHPTIAGLAPLAAVAAPAAAEQGVVTGEVPLTPAQHRLLAGGLPAEPRGVPLLLRARGPLGHAALEGAVRALAIHHDALRLRFARGADGRWTQHNAGLEQAVPVERIDLAGLPEAERAAAIEAHAAALRDSLDPGGPLARVAHFDAGPGEPARVLLLAHPLVADRASRRILQDDLDTALGQLRRGGEAALPPKTTSFRAWAEMLAEHVRSGARDAEAAFWTDPVRDDVPPLPADADGALADDPEAAVVAADLSPEETRALLHDANAAYRTRPEELLLAALARAWGRRTGDARLRVELESTGRARIARGADPSRTVGPLADVYPLLLDLRGAGDEGAAIRTVKERLRAVPDGGIGHGLLRWLGPDQVRRRLAEFPAAQAGFRWLGHREGVGADEGELRADGEVVRAASTSDPPLLVTAAVEDGRLVLRIARRPGLYREETVRGVLEDVAAGLRALLAHCASPEAGGYTPSDFPLAGLGQAELDELLGGERGVEDVYPATPMQEGMLFHSLLAPGGGAYVGQLVCDLVGDLDVAAFERAWRDVVRRHAVLRTGFARPASERPLQVVRGEVELPVRGEDWRGLSPAEREARLDDVLAADRERGFDPARPPLMRLALFRTGERRHRLVWTHHHLLLDGWSLPLVFRDVAAAYDARAAGREPPAAPGRPFRDYVAWLARQDAAAAERFWSGQLAGIEGPTPLGIDRVVPTGEAGFLATKRELPAELSARLGELARRGGLTFNTLVQGAWALLLSRYSGEADVVFGATVSGRPAEVEGVEEMVGLFINTLPARVAVPADAPALPWLRGLQERQARLRDFEYSPLAEVQRLGEVRGAPLFESILAFENFPVEDAPGDGAGRGFRVEPVGALQQTDYPLTLTAALAGPERVLVIQAACARSRFEADAVERMLDHFGRVLEAFAADPEVRLGDVPLLSPDEARRLTVDGDAAERHGPAGPLAHDLFAERAASAPEAAAISHRGATLSYGELDRRANRLAHHLRALGAGPETRVGVCLERTPELVVALLGVLKAGAAYLPLDPAYPAGRLALMLADAGAPLVVTEAGLSARLPASGVALVAVDADGAAIAARPDSAPESGAGPENLSHVIYTSGSTGRPKGVMVRHAAVAARLRWLRGHVGDEDRSAVLFATSVSFDVSVAEVLGTLCWGGRLVLVDNAMELAAVPAAEGVRSASMVPTAAAELLSTGGIPASVRTLNLGGEALPADLARALYGLGHVERVVNLYGPTEDTTYSTFSVVERGADRVLIGRPLPGTRAYVLDAELRPSPVGVAGELYLAGAGLARGYLDRPELTAERFVPDPFGASGTRMYRVMDRARRTAEGELEYLGRTDFQVKVRGFRIEPGEVEAALRTHPAVREAVAMVRAGADGEPRLVAWTVAAEGEEAPASRELRRHLRERLPEHMVPAFFVAVETLPLTPSGKLDRRALPAPDGTGPARREYVAPRTPLEELLAGIVGEVLGAERVGVHDHFLDLGGHSLLAARVAARIRRELDTEIELSTVFEAPTVAELAGRLAGVQPAVEDPDQWELAAELERLAELSPEEALRFLREGRA